MNHATKELASHVVSHLALLVNPRKRSVNQCLVLTAQSTAWRTASPESLNALLSMLSREIRARQGRCADGFLNGTLVPGRLPIDPLTAGNHVW
jgi:hypothetical protein